MSSQAITYSDEKPAVAADGDVDSDESPGFSSWFGGKEVRIGPRIGPVLYSSTIDISSSDESSDAILVKQRELEDGNAIQYRTCSWQKVSRIRS